MDDEPYTIPDVMALTCIKRGMAVKIFLRPSLFETHSLNGTQSNSSHSKSLNGTTDSSDDESSTTSSSTSISSSPYYIFQKRYDENNVTISQYTDPESGIVHVKKKHAPLNKGVHCVQYGPMSFEDKYNILGKIITIDQLKWFICKSVRIEALPYIKRYEDNTPQGHARRLNGVKSVIEKMWKQPATK